MAVHVLAVDRPDVPPYSMSDRFRHEIAYFMRVPGTAEHPDLPAGEYWIDLEQARTWYDDGVIPVVSPLDSENRTEVELSEEHENWLAWVLEHQIGRVRLE